ncbi:hypothetical protein [Miltoncostaea marina]|uniref:hypothetical protein n=1 Tax=Miltoncostaea marina TaxID=2843215 RepID=UPI001C3CECD6|nr:hypothetical protein [Miltoncostaea marina]
MTEPRRPPSRAEREAQRALLQEALARLADEDDPEGAAAEVVRALDAYMESAGGGTALAPREPPVTDFARREASEVRWVTWVVVGGAVLGTAIVGVALSGGWPAALAILAIWVLALIALTTA